MVLLYGRAWAYIIEYSFYQSFINFLKVAYSNVKKILEDKLNYKTLLSGDF